jgi:hypothetical protein
MFCLHDSLRGATYGYGAIVQVILWKELLAPDAQQVELNAQANHACLQILYKKQYSCDALVSSTPAVAGAAPLHLMLSPDARTLLGMRAGRTTHGTAAAKPTSR